MQAPRNSRFPARRTLPLLLSVFVLCLTHAASQASSSLPTARPEDVGASSQRLERLDQTVQQYVNEGKVSGVVTLVLRKGQVVQSGAYGKRDIESGSPMTKDAIFRIASMSKAITSVAVMMLMEEGKLTLADRVSRFIPQFKNTTVAVEYRDGTTARPAVVTVPAKREILGPPAKKLPAAPAKSSTSASAAASARAAAAAR